ncbi:hypothetical protein DL96DRAFT_393024 [Flagelloscypha sp. PMI_526]|nr:hypothetical protein DL96DRAFT_393024 [Flagelloscypha sp. PMI_526]
MSLADEILASDAYKHIRIFVPEPRPTEPRLSLPSLFPAELSVENPWEPNLEDTVIRSRMENLLTRTSPSYASADEVGRNMSGEANTKHRVPPEPLFSVYIQHPPMFKQSKPLSSHHETRQALSNNETYFSDTEPKLNDSRIAKTIVQLPRNRVLLPFVPDSPPTTVSIRWGNKIISNPWEPGISDGAVRRRMETLLATLNTFRESQIPFLPKFSKCTLSRRANPTCWAPATSNFVEELLQLDEFQVVRPHIPNPRPEGQKFQFLLTSQLNPWEVGISEFNAETRIERLKKALLRLGPQKPSSMDGEVSNPVCSWISPA